MWNEIQKIGAGEHVALFYRTRTEQLAAIIPYIMTGLERNERCLYIAEENSVGIILKHLRDAGVDVDEALGSHALRVTTKADTYLRHGIFQAERMAEELRAEVKRAEAEGFAGFRGSGEMSWALALESSMKQLSEYEAALHKEFPTKFTGLCQFNETTFPPRIICEMIRWHQRIFARGRLVDNPYFNLRPSMESEGRLITVDDVFEAGASEHSMAATA